MPERAMPMGLIAPEDCDAGLVLCYPRMLSANRRRWQAARTMHQAGVYKAPVPQIGRIFSFQRQLIALAIFRRDEFLLGSEAGDFTSQYRDGGFG